MGGRDEQGRSRVGRRRDRGGRHAGADRPAPPPATASRAPRCGRGRMGAGARVGVRPTVGRPRLALRGRGPAAAADALPGVGIPADSGARHAVRPSLLDLGDAPGVIDWQRFGQGPQELDAGTFLATIWRIGLKDERLASEAKRAEETFLARTAGLLDKCAVAWYRAAVLLRLACKCVRRHSDWLAHGHALLREAVRQTEAAG